MRPEIELLEDRAVPATLIVTGTPGNDALINVNTFRPEATTVSGAASVVGVPQNPDGTYTLSLNDLVVVEGLAGNDYIRVTGYVPTILRGGAGNDYIFGGYGNDVIFGGEGNDYIRGGLGNDLIIGRAGTDYLYGDAGNDIMVGGNFDESGLNNADLQNLITTNDVAEVVSRSSDDGAFDLMVDTSGADAFVISALDYVLGNGLDDTVTVV